VIGLPLSDACAPSLVSTPSSSRTFETTCLRQEQGDARRQRNRLELGFALEESRPGSRRPEPGCRR
jgi:hypothetical protein